MPRNQWQINNGRIERALLSNGITKRSQLLPPHYDKDADFVNVYDLGEVLGPQLRRELDDHGPIEWKAAFPNIEYDTPYGEVKGKDGTVYTIVDSGEKPIGE